MNNIFAIHHRPHHNHTLNLLNLRKYISKLIFFYNKLIEWPALFLVNCLSILIYHPSKLHGTKQTLQFTGLHHVHDSSLRHRNEIHSSCFFSIIMIIKSTISFSCLHVYELVLVQTKRFFANHCTSHTVSPDKENGLGTL